MADYALRHHGTITRIGNGKLSVTIASSADCSGCAVKSVCHPSGKTDAPVEIEATIPVSMQSHTFREGDKTEVAITTSGRMRAVALALALPCLLLIVAALITLWVGASQIAVAFCGIIAVAVYYIIIYILRRRLFATPRWVVVE